MIHELHLMCSRNFKKQYLYMWTTCTHVRRLSQGSTFDLLYLINFYLNSQKLSCQTWGTVYLQVQLICQGIYVDVSCKLANSTNSMNDAKQLWIALTLANRGENSQCQWWKIEIWYPVPHSQPRNVGWEWSSVCYNMPG